MNNITDVVIPISYPNVAPKKGPQDKLTKMIEQVTGYKTRPKGMGSLQRERNGVWTIRITVDGRRLSKTTGTTDLKKAEQILEKFIAPLGFSKNRIPLNRVFRQYELSPKRRDLAPSTLISKKRVWNYFIQWVDANHPYAMNLDQISTKIISEFLAEYRIGHTGTTYNNNICVIREIFHTLQKDAGIMEDPWEGIKLRADDSHTRRELTIAELQDLMSAACALGDVWRKLFTIGIYTGLRLGDCCKLKWNECLLDRGIIQVIPQKTAKHRKGRPVTIPIHPVLLSMLMETPPSEQKGPVVPFLHDAYTSGNVHPIQSGLKKIFQSANIKTGIMLPGRMRATPDASFHSLRHTFVSLAVNAGVPISVVQSIVGHESNTMTRHYYHENLPQLQNAVAAIPQINIPKLKTIEVKSSDPDIVGAGVAIQKLPCVVPVSNEIALSLQTEQK